MGLTSHLLDVSSLLLLILGPLPLSVALCGPLGVAGNRSPVASLALASILLWCGIQMSVGLLLGMIGSLHLGPLLLVETFVLAAGVLAALRRGPPWTALRFPSALGPPELILIATVIVTMAVLLLRMAAFPIKDYDSIWFHLPVVANWYQQGSFVTLGEQFPIQSRYPYGWEVLYALFLMPFREDFLVLLPNVAAWLVLGLSIFLIGVELKTRRAPALAAAVLAMILPIVRQHVSTAHADLPLAAFFAAGALFVVRRRIRRSAADLALFLLCVGIVAGVRTTGLLYGALLTMALAWVTLRYRTSQVVPSLLRSRGVDRFVAGLVATIGSFVGVFWYVKNVIDVGNPIGSMSIVWNGTTILPGPVSATEIRPTMLWYSFDPGSARHWMILLQEAVASLGVPFVLLLAPAVLAGRRRRATAPEADSLFMLSLVTVAAALAFWLTPLASEFADGGTLIGVRVRYAFPFLVCVAMCAAIGGRMLTRGDLALAIMTAGAALYSLPLRPLLASLLACSLAFGLVVLVKRPGRVGGPRSSAWIRLAAVLLLSVAALGSTSWLRQNRLAERGRFYGPVARYLDAHVGETEPVGYLASRRSYPLFGPRLRRKVFFVPTLADPEERIAELRRHGIRFVAIGPADFGGQRELEWLAREMAAFTPVVGSDAWREMMLFRVKP